ncbi:hypothetical protein Syun_017373 [Stephania yunnanensis]|uniref:Uncharacterized protein n=1 Tax=Stephania yunnanensis TaxID=152371 RepID=A0AAP0P5S3_9MAGN
MVSLGVYKCDNGFKPGYLNHLEEMLRKSCPTSGIKVKPHIESKVNVLKRQWSMVNDMIMGIKHGFSGFGFDSNTNMMTALDSFPDVKEWRRKSFPFYNGCCVIFGNDRATGKDEVAPEYALKEVENID